MKKFIISILVISTVISAQAKSSDMPEQDALVAAQEESFDRGIGLPTSRFIPKGTVGGGLAVSFNSFDLGNGADDAGYKMLLSMLSGIDGDMQSFGIAPFVSYFIADNISIGLRFDYDYADLNVGSADFSVGDMLSMNVQDIGYTKQSYMGAIALRDYIPIASSKRFAMFAELRAAGGYAQSESFRMEGENKFGTYQDIYKCSIGLVPGLTCFVTNEIAIEASVGVLGYDFQKTVQTTNQVEVSQMVKNSANFKINLLSVNLGLSFYIPSSLNKIKKTK